PHLTAKARYLILDVCRCVPLPEAEGLDSDVLPGRELPSLVDPPEATFPELGKYLVPALEDGTDRQHVSLAPRRTYYGKRSLCQSGRRGWWRFEQANCTERPRASGSCFQRGDVVRFPILMQQICDGANRETRRTPLVSALEPGLFGHHADCQAAGRPSFLSAAAMRVSSSSTRVASDRRPTRPRMPLRIRSGTSVSSSSTTRLTTVMRTITASTTIAWIPSHIVMTSQHRQGYHERRSPTLQEHEMAHAVCCEQDGLRPAIADSFHGG